MRGASCWIVFVALASGCTVGEDYRRPETAAPAQWRAFSVTDQKSPPPRGTESISITEDGEDLDAWWTWFGEPLLTEFIHRAFEQNLDTRAAWARISAARAERQAARAGRWPLLGAGLGANRQQNPLPGLAEGITFSLYEAGFDARWELDLFGRQRRRLEAADAAVDAAIEDQRWVLTVLCADVARAYWDMRSAEQQIALAENAVRVARDTARLSTRLVSAGIAARQTSLGAEANVAARAARLPRLRIALFTAQRQLELLLGLPPAQLAARLTPRPMPPPRMTLRMLTSPATVLRRRPDIQQAERQLAAATALKEAAIADMYPRVSLAIFFGIRNTAIDMLFSAVSKSWRGGGSLAAPLFDAGRLRAAVDVSDARVEAALVNFEKAMLGALHETELALTRLIETERQRDAWTAAVADLRAASDLASHRRAQGIGSQLEVLEAAQAVIKAEIEQRLAEATVTTETIAVLKALGAGIPRTMTPYTPTASRSEIALIQQPRQHDLQPGAGDNGLDRRGSRSGQTWGHSR